MIPEESPELETDKKSLEAAISSKSIEQNTSYFQKLDQNYLITPKLIFFLLDSAYYSCYLFKSKFFKDVLKITDQQTTLLFTAIFITTSIGSVFWNYLVDATNHPKTIVCSCMLGLAGIFQLLLIETSFQVQVFIVLLWTFSYSALHPLMDSIIVGYLENTSHGKEFYSRQRIWGSFAYIIVTVLLAGLIDSRKSTNVINSYIPMYVVLATSTALFLICFITLIPNITIQSKKSLKFNQVLKLLCNIEYLFLLLVVLVVGIGRQVILIFRAVFVEDHVLGNDPNKKLWVAVSAIAGFIMELVVMYNGKRLLQTIGKHKLLLLSLFTMSFRLLGYALIPSGNPLFIYMVIAIEFFLRGVCTGSIQVAAVQIAAQVAGPDLQATAQGIVASVANGVCGIFGSLIVALVLSFVNDLRACFSVCAVINGVVFLIAVCWSIYNKTIN